MTVIILLLTGIKATRALLHRSDPLPRASATRVVLLRPVEKAL
jgi:hypothetical protein